MLRSIAITAAVLLGGCGPAERYRIQTNHFRAVYDREWQIVRERDGRAVGIRFARTNDDLVVRVFGWLARKETTTANAEALWRLWDEPSVELREHRPGSSFRAACGPEPTVTLFGEPRPLALLASPTWRTFVASAHAEGSLITIVAQRPLAQVTTCDDERRMVAEVQRLVDGLAPSQGPGPARHQSSHGGLPGRPAMILAPPVPADQRAD